MWQETGDEKNSGLSAAMTDVVFRIECTRLPVDHATLLANAVGQHIPHLQKAERAGIHLIHVAGSQNGWERPESEDEFLLLSRRTRFRIRVESAQADSIITTLTGQTLDIDGQPLHILSGNARPISASATLFSRYTFFDDHDANNDEQRFINHVIESVSELCREYHYSPTKILCGRQHDLATAEGYQMTRSVLLADIPAQPSILLQDNGLGAGRTIGCGLLIPHKDTGEVNPSS